MAAAPSAHAVRTAAERQEQLRSAAWRGDAAAVEALLRAGGADANAAADAQADWRPLHVAAREGHLNVVKLLLQHGADVNAAAAPDLTTALHCAVENSHHAAEVARLLLDAGADVNAATMWGGTALHYTSEWGRLEVVQLLLDRGADVNAAPALGRTALHRAARSGRVEVARLLLDRGADVNATSDPASPTAANDDGGDDDEDDDDEDDDDEELCSCQPLHLAAAGSHAAVAELLLSRGADVRATAVWRSVSGATPLHCAVGRHTYEPQPMAQVVRVLLDAGAPLSCAASNGRQALHWAVQQENREAAALLLARGADVNARGDDGSTPLHVTCSEWPSRWMVQMLLERGADARAADARGWQPLHCLAAIELRDYEYNTAHDMMTAKLDRVEAFEATIETLTRHGAPVDAVDAEGRTPMMLAAASRNGAAGAGLLRCGARVGPPECGRCAANDEARTNTQRIVLGMAAEAARLRRQQAEWAQERAAWQQERAALEAVRNGSGGGGGGGGGAEPQGEEPAVKRSRGSG